MPAGGLRRGAGRKPKEITEMRKALAKNFADRILSDVRESDLWNQSLDSSNERIRLDALKALSEFKHGKAKQAVEIDGKLDVVAQVIVNL